MARPQSPTVRLRRLSLELRRLRENAGLTLTQAARAAGWQQAALSRAETRQWRQPNPAHLGALLDVYGVTEDAQPERRAELLQLAREGRRRGWWADYHVSEAYSTYVGLEAEARSLRNYEPAILPGSCRRPPMRALSSPPAPHTCPPRTSTNWWRYGSSGRNASLPPTTRSGCGPSSPRAPCAGWSVARASWQTSSTISTRSLSSIT